MCLYKINIIQYTFFRGGQCIRSIAKKYGIPVSSFRPHKYIEVNLIVQKENEKLFR